MREEEEADHDIHLPTFSLSLPHRCIEEKGGKSLLILARSLLAPVALTGGSERLPEEEENNAATRALLLLLHNFFYCLGM